MKNYYDGEKSIGQVAYGTHIGLEAAVCSYFDGRIINCMGMEPENIWNRTITAISRNSDDFMPNNKSGFAEHLLQNAYNALYSL